MNTRDRIIRVWDGIYRRELPCDAQTSKNAFESLLWLSVISRQDPIPALLLLFHGKCKK